MQLPWLSQFSRHWLLCCFVGTTIGWFALSGVPVAPRILSVSHQESWAHDLDHGDFRGGFPTYDQANALLDSFIQRFPSLISKRVIGNSYLERPISAYIITSATKGVVATRVKALLTSLMHAREPAGLTAVLYFIGHLLDLYAQGDPEAAYLLQTREIWAVPFVNPDGYIENEKLVKMGQEPSVRKNRRHTCRASPDSGVDINRNFGYKWAREFAKCSEEYQGAEPFSEPETQAIKRICEENEFKTAVNFHSFGQMLTHPFNYARKPMLPADDQKIYDEISKVYAWARFGTAIRTVGYTAPGESDDWMYGAAHIISMSPEVGPEEGGFFPPLSAVAGIDTRNFGRTKYVVTKAGLELHASWMHGPADAAMFVGGSRTRASAAARERS